MKLTDEQEIEKFDKEQIEIIPIEIKEEIFFNAINIISEKLREFYFEYTEENNLNFEWCSYLYGNNIGFEFSNESNGLNEFGNLNFKIDEFGRREFKLSQFIDKFLSDSIFKFLFVDEIEFTCNDNILKFKNGTEIIFE